MSGIEVQVTDDGPALFEVVLEDSRGRAVECEPWEREQYAEELRELAFGLVLAQEVRPLPAGAIRVRISSDERGLHPQLDEVAARLAAPHPVGRGWAMTLIGSYVDGHGRVVSVSIEATRQGSYLVVKDRWRSPLVRDGATVELEVGAPGNARMWAECDVLARGGQLGQTGEGMVCGAVVPQVAEQALEQSAERRLERFLHVRTTGRETP